MKYSLFLFICCSINLFAQPIFDAKRNFQWVTGYQYDNIVYNEAIDNVIYDFTGDTMALKYEEKFPSSELNYTNGSVCDKAGALLLYSSGCRVHEGDGTIIPNTDTMNSGFVHDLQCHDYMGSLNSGYTIPEGLMILPVRENSFKVFYLWFDYVNNFGYYIFKLYSMELDKNENSGHFEASNINQTVLNDTLEGSLASCRHANGREWWLICPKANSNRYFIYMIDSSGIKQEIQQDIGASRLHPYDEASGQCAFSPDGSKFVEYCIQSDIKIFDFDRCTGELSNPIHIPIHDYSDTIFSAGACFSPNSRYLYIPSSNAIYQFDMWANNIPLTKQIVAIYDGVKMGFLPLDFNHAELAPDGKIYICNWAGRTTYHVIEHPDSAGVACGVIQHAQWTKWAVSNIPHHPNYLLGPMVGSGCDTIVTTNTPRDSERNTMTIYPNPFHGQLTIELSRNYNQVQKTCQVLVINQLGQTVAKQAVSPFTSIVKLPTNTWPLGVYFVQLMDGQTLLASKRVVKVE